MFTGGRPHRAIFSVIFAALLLSSAVAAQDKHAGAPGPSDATALPILNLNPLARPTPEKATVAQDGLIDFTLPRMKLVGLIPPSNRDERLMAQAGPGSASVALRLTLDEALARAVATNALVAASAGVSAAHYRHKAVQSDYFPKVGAYLVNLHFNKFMGDTFQLFRRGIIFPTVSRAVPLFDKDMTFVGPTVTQPLTPLFKVYEAVRIAKADERIARAKANAASVQLTADVERAYFDLLIAQRRQAEARANVEIIAAWTIFDFSKRERTIKERDAQVTMAKANLEMGRAKSAAATQKMVMDLDRTRRILELTRRVASMQGTMTPCDQDPGPEARAALAKAEAGMFQAELDYRMAYAQMNRAEGEQ